MDFRQLDKFEHKIGKIIENMKSIEYLLDCIIINRIETKDVGFVRDIILNTNILSFGNKLKILKTICRERGKKDGFSSLHRLINIRNLFAHESSYIEDEDMIVKMNELKSNGKYIEYEFEKLYEEFLKIYNEEFQKLTELLSELKK